jgi:serine/threonine protein kinase
VSDETRATSSAGSTAGLDDTVAASQHGGAAPVPHANTTSVPRSSVLPRIEGAGSNAKLVADGKPRYEHRRRLGEGGIGEVFGAHDNDIQREVAVKRLRPGHRSATMVARFAEEVRTIGALEHPNIVPIHDVGVDENGDYYFVMKYVEGETLEAIIDRLAAGDAETHARFGFERRVQIFLALLDAVGFAHARGIVHRDIKPANVMLGAYGEVVLMDWGIAKRVRDAETKGAAGGVGAAAAAPGAAGADAASPQPTSPLARTRRGALFETRVGEIIGTPAYMSPEQARGESIDERSDVYSLCVLFHELLSLRHPLADKTTLDDLVRGILEEAPPITSFVPSPHQTGAPVELSWFIRKGLEKKPADRYQSVAEMIERLDRRAEGQFPIQCHITFVKRVNRAISLFVDRHPRITTMILAMSVLAVVAASVVLVVHALRG